MVKAFYEQTPFPNYEDVDSRATLIEKAREGKFAESLDASIGERARVLDAGCGTGQLTNFLGLCAGREVYGADVCMNSLRLANRFKLSQKIDNVVFLQMNLFRPAFKPCTFDVVVSNGVLHHTGDPFEGFKSLSRLVRTGGYIIVGLYNKFGRVPLELRRALIGIAGRRLDWIDSRLRDPTLGQVRKQTWFADQYRNPHESTHTIGEVLHWFDKTGFEFVHSVPSSEPFYRGDELELFEPAPRGTFSDHVVAQSKMILSGGGEGGFYVMIGRRS